VGFETLSSLGNLENAKRILESRWGKQVKDYIEFPNNGESQGWNWKSLENMNLPNNEKKKLIDILNSRTVSLALVIILPRTSAIIIKRKREIGSPCLNPLDILKKPSGVPLTKTENLGLEMHA